MALPAPLVPPHRLAEVTQALLGIGWKPAYLVATLGGREDWAGTCLSAARTLLARTRS